MHKRFRDDKKAEIFHCVCCDYNTSYQSKYDRHILTDKHAFRTNETKKGTQTMNSYVCEKCNTNFNSRTTMWRHKKTCDVWNKGEVMKLTALITQLEYLTIVRNVCEPIENEDKNGKKIIHNISLNVFVDKGL